MSPYSFTDYKEYLAEIIEKSMGRGAKAQLAEAAGCQRSFFSQVLNGPTHLTMEHAIGIARHIQLDPNEQEYFLCLVGTARSASATLTKYYGEKMAIIKNKAENLSKRLKTSKASPNLAEYYSNWKYSAIHILCTIPTFQSSVKISKKLQLEVAEVEHLLKRLNEMGLVELHKGRWLPTKNEIHLPKDHFMTPVNHRNWREQNLIEARKDSTQNIQYTAVYSMSRKDYEKFKELTLDFLEDSRGIVAPSKEEELVGFTLDCILY